MRRILAALLSVLLATPAWSADNTVVLTPGTGVTMRSVDIGGGVQSGVVILGSTTGTAIYGTAGTANANVISIQGIASMTKLLVTPDANSAVNVAQINGVTPLMGNGVTGTGSQRVTIASDNTPFSVIVSNANSNGQTTMANSSPVVIASNQSAVPVSVASGGIASGAVASGAFASGSVASGAIASGAVASGAYASGSLASGAMVDLVASQTPIAPATATATKGLLAGYQYNSTQATFTNGQQGAFQGTSRGALYVANGADPITVQPGNTANTTPWLTTPSASSAFGSALTTNTCGSAVSSCVLKASAGNFYGAYAECTSACWLMVFNATSAPTNGATTAGTASGNLVECIDISAGSSKSITYPTFPRAFSVGVTVAISSTACATLTLSTVGFVSGSVM